MSPTTSPRSTRDRPAKPPLSLDAVIDAAVAILAADGLEAVTMRRVATALDTGPGSLYVYVSGRDALVAAILGRVTASVRLEPVRPARWRSQLHGLLDRMRQALVAYPGIAVASLADPPDAAGTLEVLENLLALLRAGGLTGREAAWGADVLAQLVTHAAIEQDVRATDLDALAGALRTRYAQLPAARFPSLSALADDITAGDAAQRFRYAVDVVLDGLLARSEPRR